MFLEDPPPSLKTEFTELSVFKLPWSALVQIFLLSSGLKKTWLTLWFVQLKAPYEYKELDRFYSALSSWAQSNPSLMQDSDIHSISYLSLPLGISFQRIFVAVRDNAVESVQRRGVADLVEMAFSGRLGCTHKVQ